MSSHANDYSASKNNDANRCSGVTCEGRSCGCTQSASTKLLATSQKGGAQSSRGGDKSFVDISRRKKNPNEILVVSLNENGSSEFRWTCRQDVFNRAGELGPNGQRMRFCPNRNGWNDKRKNKRGGNKKNRGCECHHFGFGEKVCMEYWKTGSCRRLGNGKRCKFDLHVMPASMLDEKDCGCDAVVEQIQMQTADPLPISAGEWHGGGEEKNNPNSFVAKARCKGGDSFASKQNSQGSKRSKTGKWNLDDFLNSTCKDGVISERALMELYRKTSGRKTQVCNKKNCWHCRKKKCKFAKPGEIESELAVELLDNILQNPNDYEKWSKYFVGTSPTYTRGTFFQELFVAVKRALNSDEANAFFIADKKGKHSKHVKVDYQPKDLSIMLDEYFTRMTRIHMMVQEKKNKEGELVAPWPPGYSKDNHPNLMLWPDDKKIDSEKDTIRQNIIWFLIVRKKICKNKGCINGCNCWSGVHPWIPTDSEFKALSRKVGNGESIGEEVQKICLRPTVTFEFVSGKITREEVERRERTCVEDMKIYLSSLSTILEKKEKFSNSVEDGWSKSQVDIDQGNRKFKKNIDKIIRKLKELWVPNYLKNAMPIEFEEEKSAQEYKEEKKDFKKLELTEGQLEYMHSLEQKKEHYQKCLPHVVLMQRKFRDSQCWQILMKKKKPAARAIQRFYRYQIRIPNFIKGNDVGSISYLKDRIADTERRATLDWIERGEKKVGDLTSQVDFKEKHIYHNATEYAHGIPLERSPSIHGRSDYLVDWNKDEKCYKWKGGNSGTLHHISKIPGVWNYYYQRHMSEFGNRKKPYKVWVAEPNTKLGIELVQKKSNVDFITCMDYTSLNSTEVSFDDFINVCNDTRIANSYCDNKPKLLQNGITYGMFCGTDHKLILEWLNYFPTMRFNATKALTADAWALAKLRTRSTTLLLSHVEYPVWKKHFAVPKDRLKLRKESVEDSDGITRAYFLIQTGSLSLYVQVPDNDETFENINKLWKTIYSTKDYALAEELRSSLISEFGEEGELMYKSKTFIERYRNMKKKGVKSKRGTKKSLIKSYRENSKPESNSESKLEVKVEHKSDVVNLLKNKGVDVETSDDEDEDVEYECNPRLTLSANPTGGKKGRHAELKLGPIAQKGEEGRQLAKGFKKAFKVDHLNGGQVKYFRDEGWCFVINMKTIKRKHFDSNQGSLNKDDVVAVAKAMLIAANKVSTREKPFLIKGNINVKDFKGNISDSAFIFREMFKKEVVPESSSDSSDSDSSDSDSSDSDSSDSDYDSDSDSFDMGLSKIVGWSDDKKVNKKSEPDNRFKNLVDLDDEPGYESGDEEE